MVTRCLLSLVLTIVFDNIVTAQVSIESLLREMADRSALARFPEPVYQSLQSSSYNRASVTKDSAGWYADSDGTGFIRTEEKNGRKEWVVMEHEGPGAITRMWAPYFYHGGLDDLEGPDIHIYIDGDTVPAISENYFKLITGRGSFPDPFARRTARAGDGYMPVPFAKSCKVTFNKKPFYHIINYRGYAPGTSVKRFSIQQLRSSLPVMDSVSRSLHTVLAQNTSLVSRQMNGILKPGWEMPLIVQRTAAIREFSIEFDPQQLQQHPQLLRSIIVTASFDGKETVWVPLGDFFSGSGAVRPFQTFTRTVNAMGQMSCTWVMPFEKSAVLALKNIGEENFNVKNFRLKYSGWDWDERSMHFHANWRSNELLPGNIFRDWNFIDIKGKGVIVGDQLTVINPDEGWWGEGDEKIYIDEDRDRQFPGHFGTGTEDYYGWAGGENPGKDDIFSHPFLANIEVGSVTSGRRGARGFNICTRVRALDAIPFQKGLVFDMEASPGTQIRNPWDFLDFSAVVFWYGAPGVVHNRPALPAEALKPLITLQQIDSMAIDAKKLYSGIKGAIEVQTIRMKAISGEASFVVKKAPEAAGTNIFNRGDYFLISSGKAGGSVVFTLTEQFKRSELLLAFVSQHSFCMVQVYVNGIKAGGPIDLSNDNITGKIPVSLGVYDPLNNEFNIQLDIIPVKTTRIKGCSLGLDYFKVRALD
ncbi:MAG: DUF2961 domain-containing protein [Chitinophagaceae bacterium]|nr:DUF2961 domain-containing protein [Chitinophagaceae bacterium]